MWDDVAREIEQFPTAVLTTLDEAGYPVSVRCTARFDAARAAVDLVVPGGLDPAPGPANLLFHRHDEKIWKMRELVILGDLDREADGWTMRPTRLLQGQGRGGAIGRMRGVLRYRKTAARYLAQRGLARPAVDWDSINRLRDEANAMERGR